MKGEFRLYSPIILEIYRFKIQSNLSNKKFPFLLISSVSNFIFFIYILYSLLIILQRQAFDVFFTFSTNFLLLNLLYKFVWNEKLINDNLFHLNLCSDQNKYLLHCYLLSISFFVISYFGPRALHELLAVMAIKQRVLIEIPIRVNLLDFEQLKEYYYSSSSCMKVGLGPAEFTGS